MAKLSHPPVATQAPLVNPQENLSNRPLRQLLPSAWQSYCTSPIRHAIVQVGHAAQIRLFLKLA